MKAHKELENIKTQLLSTENKLATAHISLAYREKVIEKAQKQIVQLREEANIFHQSNNQLKQKLNLLSKRHDTFGLFLNKFVSALRELGQEIDDNELILFLTDENEAAAKIYGECSVICKRKSWYLDGIIQSTAAAAEVKCETPKILIILNIVI